MAADPADHAGGPGRPVAGGAAANAQAQAPVQTEAQVQTFERLRAQFLAGLPQRWLDISAAPDAQRQQAALHRLAGAAGSYGLPALGLLAARAERLSREGQHPLLPAALQELQALIAAGCATLR